MLMRLRWLFCGAVLAMPLAGCEGREARAETTAGRVVDSVIDREEALRRFRTGLARADSLSGGARTREELVAALVRALGARDTSALVRMALTRSEFAYLYYPTTPQALPPYDLEPGLMWFLLFERSNQGVRRALERFGGQRLRVLGHDCGKQASREGANTVYGPCVVFWRNQQGDSASVRVFSQIIERGGRYKFVSYANRL